MPMINATYRTVIRSVKVKEGEVFLDTIDGLFRVVELSSVSSHFLDSDGNPQADLNNTLWVLRTANRITENENVIYEVIQERDPAWAPQEIERLLKADSASRA